MDSYDKEHACLDVILTHYPVLFNENHAIFFLAYIVLLLKKKKKVIKCNDGRRTRFHNIIEIFLFILKLNLHEIPACHYVKYLDFKYISSVSIQEAY